MGVDFQTRVPGRHIYLNPVFQDCSIELLIRSDHKTAYSGRMMQGDYYKRDEVCQPR